MIKIRFVFLCVFLLSLSLIFVESKRKCPSKTSMQVSQSDEIYSRKPNVDGMKTFYGGIIGEYTGPYEYVTSPIIDSTNGERAVIGKIATMKKDDLPPVVESAKNAWNNGQGIWPQLAPRERIEAIQRVVISLKERRDEIANVLMWEICKSVDDAYAEFDRTMVFIDTLIKSFKELDHADGEWKSVNGILSKTRRSPVGIVLALAPFNYPFNEAYSCVIPALLMGNVVIMKIPTTGGLAHMLTMEAYARHLPPGTFNFISGAGRELLSPLMQTGIIDSLAFIGGSSAADKVIKSHPHPHRLKVFLQLEGKNLGIVLPDADLDVAAEQVTVGATSYNGQRCTAIKLVMVHKSLIDSFLPKLIARVDQLRWGLPWEEKVAITPLPEHNKIEYLTGLIEDAQSHGADVVNAMEGGCEIYGALMRPAIVYPVTSEMRLWHEEQFGPVIPVAVYNDISEITDYLHKTPFGQQAAVFTKESTSAGPILDILSTAVGRININTQCGRSPDVFPFSGRRSSALGTMSVSESLRTFSIETVIAGKHNAANEAILKGFDQETKFFSPLSDAHQATAEL